MIQAVIFDLDGTVLDNEGEWEEAFRQVAAPLCLKVTLGASDWLHEPGIGLGPNWKRLVSDPEKAEQLALETVRKYKALGRELKLRPGVGNLVAKIKEMGWLTALCTSSTWSVVEVELEQLNLFLAFDVMTTGEEVLLLKPDPEIYTLTAQKLEVDPQNCVVIEDAVAGVRAGVDAGMNVVCLESVYAPEKLLEAVGAKWVVKDLGEVMSVIV